MAACGLTLDDLGAGVPWRAAASFMAHAGPGSALFREADPSTAAWLDGRVQAALTADLYDAVQGLAYMYASVHRRPGSRPSEPAPYPRPWAGGAAGRDRHYGKAPVAAADFAAWWAENAR